MERFSKLFNIMKLTCCLVWLLQGLQAEQCPGADQGVDEGAGDLQQVLQAGVGDLQQVDAGDLQNRPPPPVLYPLLHFRFLVAAAPADDSVAVFSPENQVKKLLQGSSEGPALQAFEPGPHPDPC